MARRESHEFEPVLASLSRMLRAVDPSDTKRLVQDILAAPVVHLAGAGRSGLVVRAFAVRLTHLGLRAHVSGDATAPALREEELLVVCSGTGRAATPTLAAERALKEGGRLVVLTSAVMSPLARLAHHKILLHPVLPARREGGSQQPPPGVPDPASVMQPVRTLFEQACMLYLDGVVTRLMESTGQKAEDLEARLHNLD